MLVKDVLSQLSVVKNKDNTMQNKATLRVLPVYLKMESVHAISLMHCIRETNFMLVKIRALFTEQYLLS